MATRKPLQKTLITAWRQAIEEDYCSRRINSERSLQASLWSQLNQLLPRKTRQIFIEPSMVVRGGETRKLLIPDLVICNTTHVIAVIELKYQPRGNPAFAKDLATLTALAVHRRDLGVTNRRFLGSGRRKVYPFSDRVLWVWAGVHRDQTPSLECMETPVLCQQLPELQGDFLQLHAETHKGHTPCVFWRTG